MALTLTPRDAKDVEEAVGGALAAGRTIEVIGQGSKRAVGRPLATDLILDLSALAGVTLYEPEELVLSVRAGTPLTEIDALLASHHQELAFEPLDYGPVLSQPAGRGTIGGAIAANLAGPRRVKAGAARDHLLGLHAVSGRGEAFKAGGRVVKNVTGYDLCKLIAGSWGTLAMMTEVTLKTLPRAETEMTLLLLGMDIPAGCRAMSAAMASACDISGAAILPGDVTAVADLDLPTGISLVAFRLEGIPPSLVHRRTVLESVLRPFGELAHLEETASHQLWRSIRDVRPLAVTDRDEAGALWRISLPPSSAAAWSKALPPDLQARTLYDWAGGLIWLRLREPRALAADIMRVTARALGGHAMLIDATPVQRAAIDMFSPQEPGLAALTRRVKRSFDPEGLLNPGRLWAGV